MVSRSSMAPLVFSLVVWMLTLDFAVVSGQITSFTAPRNATVSIFESVQFQCSAQPPNITVTWLMDGLPVSTAPGSRRTVVTMSNATDVGSALTVANATADDSATYACRLDDGNGTTLQLSAVLIVLVMPVAVVTPSELMVVTGSPAMFTCSAASGTAPFVFQWMTAGAVITAGITSGVTNSTLTVNPAVLAVNEGAYTCTVTLDQSNPAQRFSASANGELLIESPPMVQTINDVAFLEGQTATVTCLVLSSPVADFSGISLIINGIVLTTLNGFSDPGIPARKSVVFSFVANRSLHNGQAVCRARVPLVTGISEDNGTFNIIVSVPPVATLTPLLPTINEGESVIFTCSASAGTPPFTFQWEAAGSSPVSTAVSSNATHSQLTISSAAVAQHEGTVTCVVTLDRSNTQLQANSTVATTLTVNVPITITRFNPVQTFETLQPTLQCQARSKPAPTSIMWLNPSGVVVTGADFSISFAVDSISSGIDDASSNLQFNRNATVADAGNYTCVATNGLGTDQRTQRLDVRVVPSIVASTGATVVSGDIATLACRVRSQPRPNVTWSSVSGAAVTDDAKYTISLSRDAGTNSITFTSTLEIANAMVAGDQGAYTCTASTDFGTVAASPALSVLVPPIAMVSPASLTVNESDAAVFTCSAPTGTPPFRFEWTSANGLPSSFSVVSTATQSTLTVPSARVARHNTTYTCNVSLDRIPSLTRSSTSSGGLTVQIPPAITSFNDVSILIGGLPSLACTVRAEPAPTLTWMNAAGEIITANATGRYFILRLSSGANFTYTSEVVFLVAVRLADEGPFTCGASNAAGQVQQMATLTVNIAPVVVEFNSVTTVTDLTPELVCRVRAKPAPSLIVWTEPPTVDSGSFTILATSQDANDTMLYTSVLRFSRNAAAADTGEYSCRVQNSVGIATATTNLTVLEPPVGMVTPAGVTTINATSASFTCSASSGTAPFLFQWTSPSGAQTPVITSTAGLSSELTIASVLHGQDNGTYQCNVTLDRRLSLQRTGVATGSLTIQVVPMVLEANNVTTNVSLSVTLTCRSRGDPPPSAQWRGPDSTILAGGRFTTDDTVVGAIEVVHTLTVAVAAAADHGSYTCEPSNAAANTSAVLFLTVQVLPEIAAAPPAVIGVTGRPAKLTIDVTFPGRPAVQPSSIVWTKNGDPSFNQIDVAAGHSVTPDRLCLNFANVTTADDATYTVTACNEAGCVSVEIILEEQRPPQLLDTHQNTSVDGGETVSFTCSAAGMPTPTITWQLNGTVIADAVDGFEINSTEDSVNMTITSTLSFSAMFGVVRGNGRYACVATNTQPPQAVAAAVLQVFTQPVVAEQPMPVQIVAENPANFTCTIAAFPTPEIVWLRDVNGITEELVNASFSNIQIEIVDIQDENITSQLTVLSVGLDDLGNYSCQGRHTEFGISGTVTSEEAFLDVYVSPLITIPAQNVTVNQFDNTSLFCQATGRPAPVFFWSSLMSSVETTSGDENSLLTVNTTLSLSDVAFSDRGRYVCLAFVTQAGFDDPIVPAINGAVAVVYVTVNVDVNITEISPPQDVTFPAATSFSCTASGFPTPTIEWLLPGSSTPIAMGNIQAPFSIAESTVPATVTDPPQLQSILSIEASQRVHNGTYTCVARTTGPSMATDTTDLTVFEVPDAPQAPTVVGMVNARNLTVTWLPPLENNAPIQRYDVSVQAFAFGLNLSVLVRVIVSDGVGSTVATVTGLAPNVNYTVRVRAANAIGDGAFSNNLYVTTDEDVPVAAPSITQLTPLTNRSVQVTFAPPAEVDRNGVIINYTITYTSLEADNITVARSGEDFVQQLTAVVAGLDVFSVYAFTVQAHTRIGAGPVSANVTARTLTGFSDPILNPNATVISSTSIFVEWESAVDTNGVILLYSIEQIQRDTGGVFRSSPPRPVFNTTNSTLQRLIEGLLPFTNYTFLITASTSAGSNVPVETSVVLTDEDIPSAPRNVTLSDVTTSSATVSWMPPLTPNGILLLHNYTLEGRSRFDVDAAMHTDFGAFSDVNQGQLGDLFPGFTYTVRVLASTAVGPGPFSVAAEFQTRVGIPTRIVLPPPSSQDGVPAPAEDTLVFNVEEFPNANGPFGRYHLVVVRLPDAGIVNQDTNVLYAPGSELLKDAAGDCNGLGNASHPCAYIAVEFLPSKFENNVYRVAVGDGTVTMDVTGTVVYRNTPLVADTAYTVFVRGFVQPETQRRRRKRQDTTNAIYAQQIASPFYYPRRTCSSTSIVGPVVGAVVGGILFGILLMLVILYIFRQRKTGKMDVTSPNKSKKASKSDFDMVISNPLAGAEVAGGADELEVSEATTTFKKAGRMRAKSSSSSKGKLEAPSNRGPIAKERFSKHSLEMQQTNGFNAEYDIIQQSSPKMLAAETCSRPSNKLKNRYANIIAYDETRVVLPVLGDDPDSDYINANWLDGYKHPREFIATQGPVPQSIIDFWRMVWDTNAKTIAMLTNLEENGRLKCNQYWPTQGGIIYGELVVTLTNTLAQSHYVVRTFQLAPEADVNKGETESTREVKQYHFTAWPDHGVPTHPTPLLTFWQRIRKHQPRLDMSEGGEKQPPIVVHCSAGVGRTGTLVVIDAMIAQAEKEGRLDVFNYVMELRRQRNFMVQTDTQYRFIHDALVEYFSFDVTEVQVNELRPYIQAMEMMSEGEHGYDIEFKKLSGGVPNRSPTDIALRSCNKKKNRFASFVPFNQPAGQVFSQEAAATPKESAANGRVTLPPQPNVDGSEYINASFIDSFSTQHAFIATQGPLLSTITDFWTMVWKYECKSIVMLSHLREKNAEQSALYWPDQESDPSSYGDILVTFSKESIMSDFAVRDFTVTHTKERKTCTIRQFHYIGWPERGVPNSGQAMLEMVGEVERHQRSTGGNPVVVHCSNGSSRTGTFIAISSSIDRAKSENTVDVFQTVKMMRMQRAACVQSSEQYMFVYNTVRDYIASFDTYGNFK